MKTHQRVRKVIEIKNPDSYTLQELVFRRPEKVTPSITEAYAKKGNNLTKE